MKYVLIRHPYDPADPSPRWEPVQFMEDITEIPKKPKVPFRRGDVFGLISVDHVSDVVDHLKALYVAVSNKKIENVGIKPYHPISQFNWYQIYEVFALGGMFSFSSNHLTERSDVILAFLWLDHAAQRLGLEEPYLLEALREIKRWIDGNTPRGSSIEQIQDKFLTIFGKRPKTDVGAHMRNAVICCLNMIKTIRREASGDRSDISTIGDELRQAYYGKFGKSEGLNKLLELRELTLRLVPMQEVMLATAENRLIELA